MLQEAEHHGGRIVRPDTFVCHDSLQHSSLLDGANVDCGLESFVNAGRVEQDENRCLEKGARLEAPITQ